MFKFFMPRNKQKRTNSLEYQVDAKGSLGLLAAGYKGLRAWREVRDAVNHSKRKKK